MRFQYFLKHVYFRFFLFLVLNPPFFFDFLIRINWWHAMRVELISIRLASLFSPRRFCFVCFYVCLFFPSSSVAKKVNNGIFFINLGQNTRFKWLFPSRINPNTRFVVCTVIFQSQWKTTRTTNNKSCLRFNQFNLKKSYTNSPQNVTWSLLTEWDRLK